MDSHLTDWGSENPGLNGFLGAILFSPGSFPKWLAGFSKLELTVNVTASPDTAPTLQLTTLPFLQGPQV